MSRRKLEFAVFGKMFAPAIGAIVIVSLTTMNACTPVDTGLEGQEAMIQNAAEAEAAEAKMAEASVPDAKKVEAKKPEAQPKQEKPKAHVAEAKAKPARKPASAGGVFVVQIGAFKVKENAEKLQSKLQGAGYNVQMQSIEHSKNGLLHLVRFAPTDNRAEAETMIEDLKAKQDMQAQILNLPKAH